jgi:hypothetical protein
MTLTRLLEIETRFLRPGDATSLGMADGIWRRRDCPTDPRGLADVLEEAMKECSRSGVYYAAVILKRKRALERGTWKPNPVFCNVPKADASPQTGLNGNECAQCHGTGSIQTWTHASICGCGAWKISSAKVQ